MEDALSFVAWRDDAQIVEETLRKRWGEPARVEIAMQQVFSSSLMPTPLIAD